MRGHFAATPKSVGAFLVALAGLAAAFHFLDTAQAEAIGAVVTAALALLVPSRECPTPAGSPTSDAAAPTAKDPETE